MSVTKETLSTRIVPKRVLKGKDGREPFADKIEEATKTIKRVGLPEAVKHREPFADKIAADKAFLERTGLSDELKK